MSTTRSGASSSTNCPSCGELAAPGVRVCGACGHELAATLPPIALDAITTPITLSGNLPLREGQDALAWQQLEARLSQALAPRYVLLRRIGEGGMGAVYLAREPELRRLVAVKVLTPQLASDATARARFIREAQSAARIAHPNVIAIYSVGALDDDTPYFVMQYATGESVDARLAREGPVSSPEARRMIGELASALAAAHARGIIHRDVKPANVLFDEETGRVLITDFGIAAVRPSNTISSSQLTGTGMAIGTPQYMSPEQLTAEPANDRTDVYGLGLVAYEMLTGDGPFPTASPMQIMAAHLRDTPARLSERRPDVDPELEELVLACLAKDSAARPSAADIVLRLGTSEVMLEWPAPGLERLQGAIASTTLLLGTGGVMLVAGLMAMAAAGLSLVSERVPELTMFVLVLASFGALLFVAALWRLGMIAQTITRGLKAGYGWVTIAETIADVRHDGGLLIAGLREYASLSVEQRNALRQARVLVAAAWLIAGIAPVPFLAVLAWLATEGRASPPIAGLIVFVPTLALVTTALVRRWRLERLLRSARERIARRGTTQDVSEAVVQTWRETFDRARAGQPLAGGRNDGARPAQMTALLIGIAIVAVVLSFIPVFYLGVVGRSLWYSPPPAELETKLRIAETARPLVLPADPSISPLEGGKALHALRALPGDPSESRNGFVEQPVVGLPSPAPEGRLPSTAFKRVVRRPNGKAIEMTSTWWPGPNPSGLLAYAASGLSADERHWLEIVDASARWEPWRRFLRAPRADVVAARYVLPFGESLSAAGRPDGRVGRLKVMAYASIARAALYRARGERARGDTALREIVTFGFRLIDNAAEFDEVLTGIVIVGIGHQALNDAYVIDGRAGSGEYQARTDVIKGIFSAEDDPLAIVSAAQIDARVLRRRLIGTVTAPQLSRGLRLVNYDYLSRAPCTNIRELMRGSAAQSLDAMAKSRVDLARFSSEQALFELIDRTPTVVTNTRGYPLRGATEVVWGIMSVFSRMSGFVLQNPRIPGCVSVVRQALSYQSLVQ